MKDSRKAILPGFLIGCLIVIWLGSIAAGRMPPLQTPTATRITENTQEPVPTQTETPKVETPPVNPTQTAPTGQTEPPVDAAAETSTTLPTPIETEIIESPTQEPTPTQDPNCSLNRGLPSEVRQWCDLIETFAGEYGLPPGLIAAVIMQESYGDPLAYSKSGAVGLMQVMPRDGLAAEFQCESGPCFADRPTIAELQEPSFNINFGTRMLANLYMKHGSYREALFRYGPINMGYKYADIVLGLWESYP
jgi:hypothetical protein